ncbi:MAG: hypothetical protein ACXVCO_01210 [Ktedonobacterales bacterium]
MAPIRAVDNGGVGVVPASQHQHTILQAARAQAAQAMPQAAKAQQCGSGLPYQHRFDISPPGNFGDNDLYRALFFRMKIPVGHVHPFHALYVVQCADKALVMVVPKPDGKYVVIEDQWEMYPSDTLITQLRLLAR